MVNGARILESKTVIVTGASSGIGAGIAVEMAGAGANVVLVGRRDAGLEEAAERIRQSDGRYHCIKIDLERDEAPQIIVDETLNTFGGIDVLVHSAGLFDPAPFEETSLESLDRRWKVNVRAPYALTQLALPHLEPGSSIIFLSSIAGLIGFPGATAYCATKGAIELLTKALAVELAPRGIRVNAVAPGNVHTAMNAHLFASPEYTAQMLAATPAGRIGQVEDIAPGVVFLASDAARYIYGTSLVIDGGWVAQ